jgi:hypothetical protein
LLAAIADGTLPADAISPYQARQIEHHGDQKLSEQVRQIWGNLRETPAEKNRNLNDGSRC